MNSPLRGLALSHCSTPGSAFMCVFGFTVMMVTSYGMAAPAEVDRPVRH